MLLLTQQPIVPCVEVDWWTPPEEEGAMPGHRTCDFCYESYMQDVWSDKPIRRFFELLDECGCIACEHCLPGVEPAKGART